MELIAKHMVSSRYAVIWLGSTLGIIMIAVLMSDHQYLLLSAPAYIATFIILHRWKKHWHRTVGANYARRLDHSYTRNERRELLEERDCRYEEIETGFKIMGIGTFLTTLLVLFIDHVIPESEIIYPIGFGAFWVFLPALLIAMVLFVVIYLLF